MNMTGAVFTREQAFGAPTGTARPTRTAARLVGLVALLLGVGLAYPAWNHFHPVTAHAGWRYRVFAEGLPLVSALAVDGAGTLFASLEGKRGQGAIVRLDPDGGRVTVKGGLSKPDGMVAYRGGIAYTQEERGRPVRWWHGQRDVVLFAADDAEGIAFDGRHLYVVEDVPTHARLLRFDSLSGELTTLRDTLEVAEGIAACPDGRLYYAEKKKATVTQLREDGHDEVVARSLNAPGFLACDALGLWITEDATHGARLLFLDAAGKLHLVLSHLRSAQTLLPLGNGRYLLAEQGRDRVLEIAAPSATPAS